MRIATWNINGLRARLGFLRHFLAAREPDVLLLQELKLHDDHFPRAELAEAGYESVFCGQQSWNGVAVLSRIGAPELVQRSLPGQEEMGARFLVARLEAPGGPIEVASAYCPNGKHVQHEDFPRKLAWLDALGDFLAGRSSSAAPLVLGGDLNLCPGPLDTWNEELLRGGIFHTDEERSRFRRLLDLGLVDVFRGLHPDAKLFSWWDYRAGCFHKNQGLRIDFLLCSADLAPRCTAVSIDREYRKKKDGQIASDHAPVLAEIE
jgi:exodeoxyribonuclease-3